MYSKSYKRLKQMSNDRIDKGRQISQQYEYFNMIMFFVVFILILYAFVLYS